MSMSQEISDLYGTLNNLQSKLSFLVDNLIIVDSSSLFAFPVPVFKIDEKKRLNVKYRKLYLNGIIKTLKKNLDVLENLKPKDRATGLAYILDTIRKLGIEAKNLKKLDTLYRTLSEMGHMVKEKFSNPKLQKKYLDRIISLRESILESVSNIQKRRIVVSSARKLIEKIESIRAEPEIAREEYRFLSSISEGAINKIGTALEALEKALSQGEPLIQLHDRILEAKKSGIREISVEDIPEDVIISYIDTSEEKVRYDPYNKKIVLGD